MADEKQVCKLPANSLKTASKRDKNRGHFGEQATRPKPAKLFFKVNGRNPRK